MNISTSFATLTPALPAGRVARRPAHAFNVITRPWQIQPVMIAPVLPGETLKNLLLQSRVSSDPLASAMTGWWSEYYVFYVKLRDLAGRDDFVQMILTPDHDLAAYDRAATAWSYHAGPGVDWTFECLKRVVEEYFRDEGEAWDAATLDGVPLASISMNHWLDSARLDTATPPAQDHEFPGENPTLPAHMAAWADHFEQWEHMRALKLTEATFEDWLRTFGLRIPKAEAEELHRPELVRYIRDWAYPTETVDSEGAPAASVRWSHAERADKDRFFKEPGFLLAVHVCRPKVYLSGQKGSGSAMLNDAFSFLPAVMAEEPYTSLRMFQTSTGADGPLGNGPSGAYWVDLRDLYVHGDQFVNYDLSAASGVAKVALPSAALAKRFATSADADALFSGTAKRFRQDGVVNLNILGRTVDMT